MLDLIKLTDVVNSFSYYIIIDPLLGSSSSLSDIIYVFKTFVMFFLSLLNEEFVSNLIISLNSPSSNVYVAFLAIFYSILVYFFKFSSANEKSFYSNSPYDFDGRLPSYGCLAIDMLLVLRDDIYLYFMLSLTNLACGKKYKDYQHSSFTFLCPI